MKHDKELSWRNGKFRYKEYNTYHSMKDRCFNTNNENYHRYGGRGIKICDNWLESFENFYKDMGDKPKGLTLDRIDNDGNYTPENCRWATQIEQNNNRLSVELITYKGEKKSLKQWSRLLNIRYGTLYKRIKHFGWTIERAFTELPQIQKKSIITFNNETMSLGDWAKKLNIRWETLHSRINRNGWTVERAFATTLYGDRKLIEFKGKKLILYQWARLLNINPITLNIRLRRGWSIEKAFTTPVNN